MDIFNDYAKNMYIIEMFSKVKRGLPIKGFLVKIMIWEQVGAWNCNYNEI
jgi:hypothetical protein